MLKSMTSVDKVREFHRSFGLPIDAGMTEETLALRMKLISEEFNELAEAAMKVVMREREYGKNPLLVVNSVQLQKAKEHFIKELSDLAYVVDGTFVTAGIDKTAAINRVHESNMSKLGEDGKPIHREDGKVLKGPNYREADMEGLS